MAGNFLEVVLPESLRDGVLFKIQDVGPVSGGLRTADIIKTELQRRLLQHNGKPSVRGGEPLRIPRAERRAVLSGM